MAGSGDACGAARRLNPIAVADAHDAPAAVDRPNSAISAISSASQSIGSIELSRNRGSPVLSRISPHQCRQRTRRVVLASGRSRPHRPRLMPESTSSIPPAATNPSTWRMIASARQTARRSARLRNHAEGAAIAAAFLNLQIRPRLRARNKLRFFNKRVRKKIVGPDGSSAHATQAQPATSAAPIHLLATFGLHRQKRHQPDSAQSPVPAPCGCFPPRRQRRPAMPVPLEHVVHSSR